MKRMMKALAVALTPVAVAGCQTLQAVQTQLVDHSYENIDGRLIDHAMAYRVEAVQRNLATDLLDSIT